ncbi:hypothetical protein GCM10010145_21170 [Streptomyces ruber]|uniref:Uncharacterized protein n=2 Tax=Streptomyces TaxID=1883 RepID=A0A918BC10_9ACTN|nr:hypothetical protein [Streptomyces ruber]GGQ51617.1 hypothetical protein GCM10010145_21170 [Streptomyces ruber]
MVLTINLALLLAVIVFLRLRRRTEARSRRDEQLTVLIAVVLGLLLASTELGQGTLDVLGRLAEGVSQAGQ